MKTKNMIWAALSMTAALVMTACSNDDNTVETPAAQQAEVKTIPYSVTVGQGGDATTRATVESNLKTLKFATGDQLYISSDSRTDLKGTLTLKAGDEGKSSGATFEGSITYTGDAPEGTTEIKATLVGSSNVGVQITDGKVTGVSYPSDAYCDDVAEAVQKYSNLTGTSNYGEKSFTLKQQTAFLNFEITFEDGTAENATLSTVVSNGGSALCTADVKTKKDGEKVVAKFVLPVAKGTTLSGATVTMGDKAAISFGASQTLDGKVYNVKKTYAAAAPVGVLAGEFSVSSTKKVKFSKGNLRYASGTWSFFDNQYDYYTSYSADAWDKFGWSTSAPTYGMNTSTSDGTYSGDFADWGATMGTGWFTLSSDEWTYLFNTRSASTVGSTENGRYAKAKVNDVQGVILFPDTYTHPDGVTAPTGVNATDNTGWNGNDYSSADWTKMESAGCVFLPAAGLRDGSSVGIPGTRGSYWSATPSGDDWACYMNFDSDYLFPLIAEHRYVGFSVRLVRQVE